MVDSRAVREDMRNRIRFIHQVMGCVLDKRESELCGGSVVWKDRVFIVWVGEFLVSEKSMSDDIWVCLRVSLSDPLLIEKVRGYMRKMENCDG